MTEMGVFAVAAVATIVVDAAVTAAAAAPVVVVVVIIVVVVVVVEAAELSNLTAPAVPFKLCKPGDAVLPLASAACWKLTAAAGWALKV